ncbi:charged multivesicular body protein 7 [Ananas comosus]|uniref:Charged multivesicular body protein 7 n=1 Tax=Ananas comosus TaxID=4615 RepID=A0A199V981_ANACO|nr:charged multivesicular body protein 7 [Ananas comosus]OAY73578.1 Charged multivesicular body protein 7 [Ananas comosus]
MDIGLGSRCSGGPERSSSSSSSSSGAPVAAAAEVEEAVRREVGADWDDEEAWTARFKAFSGQRSDWEPKFVFWRNLILDVARRLGLCIVPASQVKNSWFSRGGLTPLCMERVLHEMHASGDILLRGDLTDPTSGHLYRIFRRVRQMVGTFGSSALQDNSEDILILKPLLQERAADVIKIISEAHWISTCVITLSKFRSFCKGPDEASAVLCYISGCGKAHYLAIRKDDFIEGVKLSLVEASVPAISRLDYDVLHLTWTTEKLQQQLEVLDRRWEISRKMALACFKSGNKQASYRHIRQCKLLQENRVKCISLVERVDEVLCLIANAESTKKVSEAIQVGARAIKEHRISIEEVHHHLQELDAVVAAQKQVDAVLEVVPLQSVDIEEEDIEAEFQKLEKELEEAAPEPEAREPMAKQGEEAGPQQSVDSLSDNLSNLHLEAA